VTTESKVSTVKFVLRFYGRFLFVRDRRGDDTKLGMTILAPTLEFPPEVCRHIPVLAIERRVVAGSHVETTVPPTWRSIPGPNPATSEFLMWDLSGTQMALPGSGGVEFHDTLPADPPKDQPHVAPVPNLGDLEELVSRPHAQIDSQHLAPGHRIGAVITVPGGRATAMSYHLDAPVFVRENAARGSDTNDDSLDERTLMSAKESPLNMKPLADFVELAI
jgi:hypothetical protein